MTKFCNYEIGLSLYDRINPNSALYALNALPLAYNHPGSRLRYIEFIYNNNNWGSLGGIFGDRFQNRTWELYEITKNHAWGKVTYIDGALYVLKSLLVTIPRNILRRLLLSPEDHRYAWNPYTQSRERGFDNAPWSYAVFMCRHALWSLGNIPLCLFEVLITPLQYSLYSENWYANFLAQFFSEKTEEREARKSELLKNILMRELQSCDEDLVLQKWAPLILRFAPEDRIGLLPTIRKFISDSTFNTVINDVEPRFRITYLRNLTTSAADKTTVALTLNSPTRYRFIAESLEEFEEPHRLMHDFIESELLSIFSNPDWVFAAFARTRDRELTRRWVEFANQEAHLELFKTLLKNNPALVEILCMCGHDVGIKDMPDPVDLLKQKDMIRHKHTARSSKEVSASFLLFFQSIFRPEHLFQSKKARKTFLEFEPHPLESAISDIMIQHCHQPTLDEINERLRPWLEGFTREEIIHFLNTERPRGGNKLMVLALEERHSVWIEWLLAQGIPIPEGFQNRQHTIGGAQGIHNEAVHYTVEQSLSAVSAWLDKEKFDADAALEALTRFVLENKTEKQSLFEGFDVVKRCFSRLLVNKALFERASGFTIEKMLSTFWYRYQQLLPADKEIALDIFYTRLILIQRGYNNDEEHEDADKPICWGGTYNNLTMALEAVAPDLVWVDFMDLKKLTMQATKLLRDKYIRVIAQRISRDTLMKDLNAKESGKLLPVCIWDALRKDKGFYEDLLQLLRCPRPNLHRYVTKNPDASINALMGILNQVTLNNKTGDYMSEEVVPFLKQIDEIFAGMRQTPSDQPFTFRYTPVQSVRSDASIIHEKNEKLISEYADRYAQSDKSASYLPSSFIELSFQFQLMLKITQAIQEQASRSQGSSTIKLYLLQDIQSSKAGQRWIHSPVDMKSTFQALGIPEVPQQFDDEDALDNFMHQHSEKLYSALFAIRSGKKERESAWIGM